MGGDHRSRLVAHRPAVLELLAKQPDLTLQEVRGVNGGVNFPRMGGVNFPRCGGSAIRLGQAERVGVLAVGRGAEAAG
jgi:hypothetical protein